MTELAVHQPTAPVSYAERAPFNTLAPIALALSFVTIIGGIVCGHVALSQIRRTGERGRWLAITALVLSYGVILLGVLVAAAMVAIVVGSRVISS